MAICDFNCLSVELHVLLVSENCHIFKITSKILRTNFLSKEL